MQEKELFQVQKSYFSTGETLDINRRLICLLRLKKAIQAREQKIMDALLEDFGKCPFDTYTTEILMVLDEINAFVRHLKHWSRPRRASAGLINFPSAGRIYSQPFGCVLVISPWNYPFMLALSPLVGAIAAGNCVILKPSSQTPHTTAVLAELIEDAFQPGHAAVVTGGHDQSDRLLELPFDFIFFTGSPSVGKKVMAKAAEHLTPVVLELGGKSPCIVDRSADLETAAKRIVWGKFVNAGQTCVAPDYLLADRRITALLLENIKREITAFYYQDGRLSQDYPRIINAKHFARLSNLLSCGEVFCGGELYPEENRIAPTVLVGVSPDSAVMQEEIFGPVLPVLEVDRIEEAIDFVNSRPKPLALYCFTASKQVMRQVLKNTSSGGGCINDTVMHVSSERLPFGGVGASGMGRYHGKASFETFSHFRSILHKPVRMEMRVKYPPHDENKIKRVKKLLHQ